MKKSRLFTTMMVMILAIAAYGQKVQPGNVFSFWEVEYTLEEGMTFEQLEKLYYEAYKPAAEKNFPGVHFYLLKGERGERTGKYMELVVFDSVEERNTWFPEKGKSSEKAKQAFDNMKEIQERIMGMIASATWTDYIVL